MNQPPSKPAADASPEHLSGTVESIVFRNDETGYSVVSIRLPQDRRAARMREELVTVVGTCAAIWEGEELRAEGEWEYHPAHGRQFHARRITCITPTSTEGIRRYLSSGMIKGIGPKLAERIVNAFGEETLEVIDNASGRLCTVEGIGESRRKLIKESWTEQRGIREIMIFLQSHGIGTAKASRIYRQYGADAIAIVKRNPYRLCEDVWGIGFKTADRIALSVGIPHDSEIRARAGLIYTLVTEAEEGGHCFTVDADLLLHAQELPAEGGEESESEEETEKEVRPFAVAVEPIENGEIVHLAVADVDHRAEHGVRGARQLKRRSHERDAQGQPWPRVVG